MCASRVEDAGTPPAAAVEHNRWPDLAVPELGSWTPSARVSVVVPVRDAGEGLARTLAALAAQTYPPDLLEVVVADDGSEPAVSADALRAAVPGAPGLAVVRQERAGFGAGRARNLGASHARGEVLLFLDADTLLEPWAVEAHARWHHTVRDAVVLGGDRNVDADGLDPAALAAADERGLAPLLEGREVESRTWIEGFLAKRDRLASAHGDLFAAFTTCNVSVRAALFDDVGGFTAYGMRGIEDTELGYRLFTAGGLFVPDPQAFGWHQGLTHFEGTTKAATKRRRTPLLQHAIPAPIIRPKAARRFTVPRVVVVLDAAGQSWEELVDAVEGVLAGRVRDVAVHLAGLVDHPDEALLREAFAPDPRVSGLGGEAPPRFCEVTVTAPPAADFGRETVATLLETLEHRHLGRVVVTLPEGAGEVTATRTRATERTARVTADRDDTEPDAVLEALFGTWWLAATQADLDAEARARADVAPLPPAALRAVETAQRDATKQRQAARAAERRAAKAEHRAAKAERRAARAEQRRDDLAAQLEAVRNRKVVRLADAAGDRLRGRRRR